MAVPWASRGIVLLIKARREPGERSSSGDDRAAEVVRSDRDTWWMPPLAALPIPTMSTPRRVGLITLRTYLVVAFVMVVLKIIQASTGI